MMDDETNVPEGTNSSVKQTIHLTMSLASRVKKVHFQSFVNYEPEIGNVVHEFHLQPRRRIAVSSWTNGASSGLSHAVAWIQ